MATVDVLRDTTPAGQLGFFGTEQEDDFELGRQPVTGLTPGSDPLLALLQQPT